MAGAVRHLAGGTHGPVSTRADAIRLLGIRVENCNREKANLNNVVVATARTKGYIPFKAKKDRVKRAKRLTMAPSSSVQPEVSIYNDAPNKENSSDSSFYPRPGEIYQVHLGASDGWYAAVVLPTGNFDSISLSASFSDTYLAHSIPECYLFNKLIREIYGWKQGFEDGGSSINRRIFPVMCPGSRYISEDGHFGLPEDAKYAWLPASLLKSLDLKSESSNLIYGCKSAREFYTRMIRQSKGQMQPLCALHDESTGMSALNVVPRVLEN